MRKLAVLLVLVAILVPSLPWTGGTAGAGGRFLPPLPPLPPILPHQNIEVLDNFSAMNRMSLELRKDGALELARSASYEALEEARLWEMGEGFFGDPLQDVAVDRQGRSIVVWDGYRGSDVNVFIQRFDQSGRKLGAEMYITGPDTRQLGAVVAANSTGGFIVAYDGWTMSGISAYAQRYDSGGNPAGGPIRVNNVSNGGAFPSIAVDSRDGFIIAWFDERSGTGDIYARRYDRAGNPLGAEIAVYTGATTDQDPCIAILPDDGFVIAWSSIINGTYDIRAQRFNSSGIKLGPVIQVNALPQDGRFPSICANSRGDFTIAWDRIFSSTVVFQRYDRNGSKLGGEVKSPGPLGDAFDVELATTSDDGFAMVWEIELSSPNAETFLQRYDRSGNALGAPMQLSRSVVYGVKPDVAVGPDDSFTVLWQNYSAWNNISIMMRLVVRPYAPSGWVMTGPVSPDHLWSWLNLGATVKYEDASRNSVSYDWSGDNGRTWTDVPANGSLGAAGNVTPVRVRATLSTDSRTTTPVLSALKLSYKFDRLPSVALPAGFSLPAGDPVLVSANATDPDGDLVAYKWVQSAGPPAAFNSTAKNLSFESSVPGNYTFTVAASDGFGAGPPAWINITVFERPPDLVVLPAEIVLSPKRPGAGKMTTVSVVVRNIGESNASLFKVRFLMDGSPLDEQDLGALGRNGSSTLTASWRARAGTHNLTVKVDSGSTVTELREDNNEASVSFKVATSSSVEAGFPWLVVILLIIAIAAAVAAVLYLRRRKPVTVIQYQPPAAQSPQPAAPAPLPPTPPIQQAPPADAPSPLPPTPPIPPAQPPAAPPPPA
jgi:hypothetical protein